MPVVSVRRRAWVAPSLMRTGTCYERHTQVANLCYERHTQVENLCYERHTQVENLCYERP
jgi:hypothetical protein